MRSAVAGSSNDSWAITWHQWHDEYPTERKIGLPSVRARSNASSPHGYQSTGLSRCWCRYGLVSWPKRFVTAPNVVSHLRVAGNRLGPAVVGFARRRAHDDV